MSAPICPMMSAQHSLYGFAPKVHCLGSGCAWWVVEIKHVEFDEQDGPYAPCAPFRTGCGTCARNPTGEPYLDPAGEGT